MGYPLFRRHFAWCSEDVNDSESYWVSSKCSAWCVQYGIFINSVLGENNAPLPESTRTLHCFLLHYYYLWKDSYFLLHYQYLSTDYLDRPVFLTSSYSKLDSFIFLRRILVFILTYILAWNALITSTLPIHLPCCIQEGKILSSYWIAPLPYRPRKSWLLTSFFQFTLQFLDSPEFLSTYPSKLHLTSLVPSSALLHSHNVSFSVLNSPSSALSQDLCKCSSVYQKCSNPCFSIAIFISSFMSQHNIPPTDMLVWSLTLFI